jgi:hypothetical protein
MLRCNKCGNPICTRCAVQTPVGYRCKSCVRSQQAIFYTALWYDYVIAAVVTLVISAVVQVIMVIIPVSFILVVLFAGLIVGGVVAEAVRLATGKRRGRYIWLVVATCMIMVSMPFILLGLLHQDVYGLLFDGAYLFLAVGAAIARLRVGGK